MAAPKRITWDEVDDLGKVSDPVIAKRLGVDRTQVFRARKRRGIPAFTQPIKWDEVDDLGKVSDRVMAERLGVSNSSVHNARKIRGIPAASRGADVKLDGVGDLGKVPDRVIAERLGVERRRLAEVRRKQGVPSFDPNYIKWDEVDDLGKVPDRVIAERLGVSRNMVYKARKRRGIPVFIYPCEGCGMPIHTGTRCRSCCELKGNAVRQLKAEGVENPPGNIIDALVNIYKNNKLLKSPPAPQTEDHPEHPV